MTNKFQGIGRALHELSGEGSRTGEELIGETVQALFMRPEGETLYFLTGNSEKEYIAFDVEGDCCSSSYFHEITGIDALLGGKVIRFNEINMPESLEKEYDAAYNPQYKDVISFYGLSIVTDKGYCNIIFRNESNGYYGGWCNKGNVGCLPLPADALQITKDGDLYKENCEPATT